jgi:rubrerythrin
MIRKSMTTKVCRRIHVQETLTPDYVLQLAEQIELNGQQYYLAAAQFYPDGSGVFLDLAQAELEHQKAFAEMRARLALKPAPPIDPEGNLAHYILNLAAGTFFEFGADPTSVFRENNSPQNIVWSAIGLEKETILFYEGVERIMPDPSDQKTVDAIIAAEVSHIGTLVKFLQSKSTDRPLSPAWSQGEKNKSS